LRKRSARWARGRGPEQPPIQKRSILKKENRPGNQRDGSKRSKRKKSRFLRKAVIGEKEWKRKTRATYAGRASLPGGVPLRIEQKASGDREKGEGRDSFRTQEGVQEKRGPLKKVGRALKKKEKKGALQTWKKFLADVTRRSVPFSYPLKQPILTGKNRPIISE